MPRPGTSIAGTTADPPGAAPAAAEHQRRLEQVAPRWDAARRDIRARVLSLLGQGPAMPPPPAARTLAVEQGVGRCSYRREHVRIRSEADDWITAWVLIPTEASGPRPAVICPHPTTEGAGRDVTVGRSGAGPGTPPEPKYSYALELASEWGFVTIAPDAFHDGGRLVDGEPPNDTRRLRARHPGWSAIGKYVWDTGRVIDYLQTRPEVDPGRIGILGHSLGAHVALFASALDNRLGACACNGGTICWDEGERMHWCCGHAGDGRWWEYLPAARGFLEEPGPVRPPFWFVELAALIAPRPLRLTMTRHGAHRQGLVAFTRELADLHAALGSPGEAPSCETYPGGHRFPATTRHRTYDWLQQHLLAPPVSAHMQGSTS